MPRIGRCRAWTTLAAAIVGLEVGLYGDDVVDAVMVVVLVSWP